MPSTLNDLKTVLDKRPSKTKAPSAAELLQLLADATKSATINPADMQTSFKLASILADVPANERQNLLNEINAQVQAQSAPPDVAPQARSAAIPQKPDPASGDYYDIQMVDGVATPVFNGERYAAAVNQWQATMTAGGYDPSKFTPSPEGTVGQVGAGIDNQGQTYSALRNPSGGLSMMNQSQIQASRNAGANPQTSQDQFIVDQLAGLMRSMGMEEASPMIGADGSVRFGSGKALSLYTGLVSQRMVDVMRNGGTTADALNAGGYTIYAK